MALFPNNPDKVCVLDAAFNQVFPDARPLQARVIERSQMFDHPIETGQIITDYSIVLPIEIDLPVIVQAGFYRNTYQQIRNLYLNKTLLTVQTNTTNYPNMVIAEMPHEERPELFDALPLTIKFRQVQIVPDPSTYDPADPTQLDTQVLGQQNGYVITGVATNTGTQTIPSYSSVPPNAGTISGVQTINGPQTIPLPTTEDIPVTGVQTVTSQQSISQVFQ